MNKVIEDKDLTFKQRTWLKLYAESGNATQAALKAYDCKDERSASVIGSENLAKLDIASLMEAKGITDNKLMETLSDGLSATKPISALILANTETGTSKTKENEGQIEVPDYAVRHKYLETGLKLKKRLGGESNPNVAVQVNFNKHVDDELKEFE